MGSSALAIEERMVHRADGQRALRAQVSVLLLLVAASFLLRLIGIERESLWIDEGWSLWFSQLDVGALWGDAAKIELHPPLYYTLLKLWTAVFGSSDLALRALSALINAFTAPLVYLSARWVCPSFKHRIGLLAALLFELSPAQVTYAHEARGYALLVFAMAATLTSCLAIVRGYYKGVASAAAANTSRPLPFVVLGLAMAMLVWSHNVGCLYAGVTGLWMGCFWLIATGASRRMLTGLAISAAVFSLLAARAIWTLVIYSMGNASEFWLTAPDGYQLLLQLSGLFGAELYTEHFAKELLLRALLFLPWPVLAWFGAARTRDPRIRWGVATLSALSFGLVLCNLVVTYTVKPVFMPRTVLPAQVGWAVLSALSMVFVVGPWRRAAAAWLCLSFLLGFGSFHLRRPAAFQKRPWREALFQLAQKAEPNGTVYTMANRESLTVHYLHAAGRRDLRVVPLPAPMTVPDVATCIHTESGCPFFTRSLTGQELEAVLSRLSADPSAWLLLMQGDSLLPRGLGDLREEFLSHGAGASWDSRMAFRDVYVYPPAARGGAEVPVRGR